VISPEKFDRWRIVPRLLVILYAWICFDTHQWFIGLKDPTAAQQFYANVIWGAAALWFNFYVNSGGKKPKPPESGGAE